MLTFGTAGLRGPMRDGPDGMNAATVERATAGLAAWLQQRCLGGGLVVVGYDGRHHSNEFATATAQVLTAAGYRVRLFPWPVPTPLLAYSVRYLEAVAGVQITASHNPASDNGYKVYVAGGAQLVSPADREIEAAITNVTAPVARSAAEPDLGASTLRTAYVTRAAAIARSSDRDLRIALTAMHGVGGELAVRTLGAAGFHNVHVVAAQQAPDPDFPTVAFPNPEEPGATDLLLALAKEVSADIAIALDPDADRCAVGVPGPSGWRMLRGDETGVLLGDYILDTAEPGSLVASTIVSSQLLAKLAAARGARHAETLTGFKWLVRAGTGLVYAYEEAIGHCVDPAAVRDKDGISAAVAVADLAAGLRARGTTLLDRLDEYAAEFGLHAGDQVSQRFTELGEIAAVMSRLRAHPPAELAGSPVIVTDFLDRRGQSRTDALSFATTQARILVRPSGTEPKLKYYLEVVEPVADHDDLPRARSAAEKQLSVLRETCSHLSAGASGPLSA